MGKIKDLTGQQFNEMTVLEQDIKLSLEKGRVYWKCRCSCGREKSVRADGLKTIKTCGECKKDLTGQIFGRLKVLYRGKKDRASHQYWFCQCECGNIVEINSDNLRKGATRSCGCLHSEITHQTRFKDLTGQKFGRLTPIKYEIENDKTYWLCSCECGNTCRVRGSYLVNGHTQSCGCINYSIGEFNIANILRENNIEFKKEHTFEDLPNRRFDFYLPQYNRLIEFDGPQHKEYNNTWHHTEEEYIKAITRDKEKNNYALQKNITLIRIPYEYRDKISLDILLNDTFKYNPEELIREGE